MKNKLLAVMAVFGMVASASAVKINNNLSINGFIDGSYQLVDREVAAAADGGLNSQDDQLLGIDQIELNILVNAGNVSGAIHIDTEDAAADNINVEQAHFTYNVNDAVSVTFGRYGSALGFEREDPAGLYTFSRAYSADSAFNFGDVDTIGAVEGVTIAYSADNFTLAASLEENANEDLEVNDLDLELSFTYTGFAGVNIGGGYFYDNENTAAGETDALNVHVSKQVGKLLLAGEFSQLEAQNSDLDAYMLLADYDVNDKLGVALRFSNEENGGNTADFEQFTVAPNYAITDSLGAILEYSDIEDGANESELIAVELTYTF